MSQYINEDIGAVLQRVPGDTIQTAWNGSSDVNGDAIDRLSYNMPLSAALGVTVTGGGSDIIVVNVEDSADGSTFAAFNDPEGNAYSITVTESVAVSGKLDINLAGARQYVRVVLSDTSTVATTAAVATEFTFGGAKVNG